MASAAESVNFLGYGAAMFELETDPAPDLPAALSTALAAGTNEHYADAELYDHEYRRRRADVSWYRRLAAEVAQEQNEKSLRILELGCGSGRLLLPLLRDGHALWGVDRAAPMLARLKKRLSVLNARARTRVHILQGDFRSLPLEGRFPLIICPFNGFQHLYTRHDVERCLAEVRRLLEPGGRFALDITHPDPEWLARDPTRRYDRTRFRHPATGEPLIYSTSHAYDPATQIDWIRLYYEPDLSRPLAPAKAHSSTENAASRSAPRVVTLAHRLFFPAEIEALLHYAGFKIDMHAGDFPARAPLDLDEAALSIVSIEQVICASVR